MQGPNYVVKLISWGKLITPSGQLRIEENCAHQFTNWGCYWAADGHNKL
jgi:hypothetical protein